MSKALSNITKLNDVSTSSGAGLVGYLPAGTGAVATTIQAQLRALPRFPENDGAVGDGSTDDTAALTKTLNNAAGVEQIFLGPKTYVTGPLTIPSNTIINFHPQTVLKAKSGYGLNDSLLLIDTVSNITINANHGTVQMLKADYTTGEQRHGVRIISGTNVTINDLHVKDTGGDGYYIGNNAAASYNIILNNCYSDNARRNGLSIVSVKNCWVIGGEYANTVGTAPEFGIDIEANYSTDSQENINLIGVSTRGNSKGGIEVVFGGLGGTAKASMSVNISNCYSYSDGYYGALRFANPAVFQIQGKVNVTNHTIINPAGRGVDFANQNVLNPPISIRGLSVTNPGFSMASPGNVDLSAISLYTTNNTGSYTTGNITFEDVSCVDNRASPTMYTGAYVGGTYPIDKVTFKNMKVANSVSGRKIVIVGTTNTNINAVQDNPEYISINGTTPNIDRYSAGDIFTTSSAGNLTLSAATGMQGLEFTFAPQTTTLTVVPATGDTLFFQGTAVSTGIVLEAGDRMKLKAIATGWKIIEQDFPLKTGSGTPVGAISTRFPGRMYYDTTGKLFWMSTGTTSSDWKQITN